MVLGVVLVRGIVIIIMNVPGTCVADAIIADLCLMVLQTAAMMPQVQIWSVLWHL